MVERWIPVVAAILGVAGDGGRLADVGVLADHDRGARVVARDHNRHLDAVSRDGAGSRRSTRTGAWCSVYSEVIW